MSFLLAEGFGSYPRERGLQVSEMGVGGGSKEKRQRTGVRTTQERPDSPGCSPKAPPHAKRLGVRQSSATMDVGGGASEIDAAPTGLIVDAKTASLP